MNIQHSMLCFVIDYIMPAMNGHGRGMRLGTCLVQQHFASPVPWPLLHASMLKNDLFLTSLHLLCTGMDEAHALVRCLVQLQCVSCVVASAACVIAKKCSLLFLISLQLVVHGHGRGTHLGTCLVQQ